MSEHADPSYLRFDLNRLRADLDAANDRLGEMASRYNQADAARKKAQHRLSRLVEGVESFVDALNKKADEFKAKSEAAAHEGKALKQVEYLHSRRMLKEIAEQLRLRALVAGERGE